MPGFFGWCASVWTVLRRREPSYSMRFFSGLSGVILMLFALKFVFMTESGLGMSDSELVNLQTDVVCIGRKAYLLHDDGRIPLRIDGRQILCQEHAQD